MNIRQAVHDDASLLSKFCMDVQRIHAARHPDVFKTPQNNEFAVPFFDEKLANPLIRIFIAEDGEEQVLGYILCELIEREENPFTFAMRYILIDQISVRPAAQGRGIGKALMAQAEKLARELNVAKIQLISWDFNTDAHVFFERLGFVKFSHRFWRNL